ncbi:macro domain-containing protein [Luteolibacter pohnpeiensis]|uniref:Macro domain-containing protein n=1 Tax=Luteolibacter pohnpeiensis TaxID=454153 RepID=A0A934VVM0_9BACT|nr:macro domain-containing protein [Luteolibacter pohnpeiensis]MBK1881948.1 macro domain-containing protein [Luteolibacter pohnpeiensis]
MRDITYTTGDATAPVRDGHKIIAHICNDIGGWGKGFVVAISRRWPEPESDYRQWYAERDQNDFGLGAVRVVAVAGDLAVANMIGQRDIRRRSGTPPIRYDAVRSCMGALRESALSLAATIHMPRIGCGLAGGDWSEIEPIIHDELSMHDIPVTVYDFP